MTNARTRAIAMRIGNSFQKEPEPFFFVPLSDLLTVSSALSSGSAGPVSPPPETPLAPVCPSGTREPGSEPCSFGPGRSGFSSESPSEPRSLSSLVISAKAYPFFDGSGGFRHRWAQRRLRLGGLAALADTGGLAAPVARVVPRGAAHAAAGDDLILLDRRGVDGEDPLHADAVADLADGEGLTVGRTLAGDDHALEDLGTGTGALRHADVDGERVTGTEVRDVGAQLGLLQLLNGGVHLKSSLIARRALSPRSSRKGYAGEALTHGSELSEPRVADTEADVGPAACGCHWPPGGIPSSLPHVRRRPERAVLRGPPGHGRRRSPPGRTPAGRDGCALSCAGPGRGASDRRRRGHRTAAPAGPRGRATRRAWCRRAPRRGVPCHRRRRSPVRGTRGCRAPRAADV